jgi:hypothetical protein
VYVLEEQWERVGAAALFWPIGTVANESLKKPPFQLPCGVPKQSPIQVLTRHNIAYFSVLWVKGHGKWLRITVG